MRDGIGGGGMGAQMRLVALSVAFRHVLSEKPASSQREAGQGRGSCFGRVICSQAGNEAWRISGSPRLWESMSHHIARWGS